MTTRRPALFILLALLAAAGCGSGDPPPRFKVAVRVNDEVGALPGQQVRVHDARGTLQAMAETDTDGRAEVEAERDWVLLYVEGYPGQGRTVTAISGLEPDAEYSLIAGIDGGEEYLSGLVYTWGQLDVTLPGAVDGATSYLIDFGAWNATTTVTDAAVPVVFWIPDAPPVTVSVTAFADGGAVLAYTVAREVPLASTLDGWAGSVVMPAWRTDYAAVAVTVTDAPAGSSLAFAVLEPAVPGGRLRNGPWAAAAGIAPGVSATLPLRVPLDTTETAQLLVRNHFDDLVLNQNGSYTYRVENGAPLLGDRTISLASLPPRLSNPQIAERDGAVVATWESAGTDPSLDATFLLGQWVVDGAELRWNVLLPPGKTRFTFPRLRDELAAWRPPVTGWAIGVESIDVDSVEGYGAFKAAWGLRFFRDRRPRDGAWVARGTVGYNSQW